MKLYDEIIEKYFKGETTLEEETKLKMYVLSPNVAEKHKYLIPLFVFCDQEAERGLPQEEKKVIKFSTVKYFKWISYAGIAACLVLAVTFFNNAPQKDYAVVYGKKIDNEAYAQKMAQQKLLKVNKMLEKNLAPIESIEKVKQTLNDVKRANETTRDVLQSNE